MGVSSKEKLVEFLGTSVFDDIKNSDYGMAPPPSTAVDRIPSVREEETNGKWLEFTEC